MTSIPVELARSKQRLASKLARRRGITVAGLMTNLLTEAIEDEYDRAVRADRNKDAAIEIVRRAREAKRQNPAWPEEG